jgi:hypothetical protein
VQVEVPAVNVIEQRWIKKMGKVLQPISIEGIPMDNLKSASVSDQTQTLTNWGEASLLHTYAALEPCLMEPNCTQTAPLVSGAGLKHTKRVVKVQLLKQHMHALEHGKKRGNM